MSEDQKMAAELRERVVKLEKANQAHDNTITELQLQIGEIQRQLDFLKRQIIEMAKSQ